jgi:hypothetical protein
VLGALWQIFVTSIGLGSLVLKEEDEIDPIPPIRLFRFTSAHGKRKIDNAPQKSEQHQLEMA